MPRVSDYGFTQTEEYSAKQRAAWTPERRAAQSARRKERATGSFTDDGGRTLLTMQDHPLAHNGAVGRHRMVLYEKIGAEDPCCHWCGKQLVWQGPSDVVVCADHLDGDTANDDPSNLVPSCRRCNWVRDRMKLTDVQVGEIRAAYARGGVTQRRLADQYGISPSMVSRLVTGSRRR